MNSRLSYLLAKKVIGIDRNGDKNYTKFAFPLIDRHGNVENYFVYGRDGESAKKAVARAIGEDSRGECIIKSCDIGEWTDKIIFRGKEYRDIQFYTDNGLPYTVLPNGEAYFLGGDEIIVSKKLRKLTAKDDSARKDIDKDISGVMGPGGGGCPVTEQKALDLKMTIWNSATAGDLEMYAKGELMGGQVLTGIQLISAYLDTSGAMDSFRQGNVWSQPAQQTLQVGAEMVREAGQIAQLLSASASSEARGGDVPAYSEDGDSPARFRRYERAVRKFNSRMKRELGIAAAYGGDVPAKDKAALPQIPAVQRGIAQKEMLLLGKPQEKGAKKAKLEKFVPAVQPARLLNEKKPEKQAGHAVQETVGRRAKKVGKEVRWSARELAKTKAKRIQRPETGGDFKAGYMIKPKPQKSNAARVDALPAMKKEAREKKKTGPKGIPVSRSGFSAPKRKTFEPLTYGCPKFPRQNPKTGNAKPETLRVRRSGQAELRARKSKTAIGLPESDKGSKGIILTERNKKQSAATLNPQATASRKPKAVFGPGFPAAGKPATASRTSAEVSSVQKPELKTGVEKDARNYRVVEGKAAVHGLKGRAATVKVRCGSEPLLRLVSPFSAPTAKWGGGGMPGRRRKKIDGKAKTPWITGFSTWSSRRPRELRRAS